MCGNKILLSENFIRCEHYKAHCSFVLPRNYNGVYITEDILFKLLSGDIFQVPRLPKNKKRHHHMTTIRMVDGKIRFPDLEAYKAKHRSSSDQKIS